MIEKKFPNEIIIGPRVELRRHKVDLAQSMFEVIDKNRELFARFLPWVDYSKTVQDTRKYIEDASNKWESHLLFDFGMFRRSDGIFVGNIGVHNISWPNELCEVGYWIGQEFEGQGFIRESTALLLNELFSIGLHRVEIRCSDKNQRSRRIPESLGFTLEGQLREDAFDNSIRRNTCVYGLLKGEWKSERVLF